ncbi:hypothetical protein V2J09_014127 [Rumex salicifolius]
MPNSNLPIPWCFQILGVKGASNSDVLEDSTTTAVSTTPTPSLSSPSGECYACTQVGIPAFHSTSCDRANQPEWQASAGSSLFPVQTRPGPTYAKSRRKSGSVSGRMSPKPSSTLGLMLGPILDPRSEYVRRWNRAVLLARGVALAVDPLFFYAISVGASGAPCVAIDGWLALVVSLLRTCVDGVHLFHLWLQFRLAYVSRESLVVGCGKLVWDPRAIAAHYVRSLKGFWFDVFVILPIPQAVFWSVVPRLVREEQIKLLMGILLVSFLLQFLPKVLHSLSLMRRMQKVTGYIFGTIWWGFGLNLIAYFIASHSCYQFMLPSQTLGNPCGFNSTITRKSLCLEGDGPFKYGIYASALPVISTNSIVVKVLYPISWGLFQLSTFGNNLTPTCHWSEVLFSIILVLGGVLAHGDGQQEEDAIEMRRHGMVDEEETVAI